jgi:hypothetical protein
MTGYPDKKPEGPAKVEQVGPYRNNTAPRAAKFGQGARSLEEIQQATNARRAHNEALTSSQIGPRTSGHHDSGGGK